MSSRVDATQFIKKLKGATQSVLTRCSDEHYYVVKFASNPEGLIALVSEVVAARLGRHLGLPMPSFQYIHVCKWLTEHSPGIVMSVDGRYKNYDHGVHFGSQVYFQQNGTANGLGLPSPLSIARIEDAATFAGALVLDAWTGGSDRREVVFARSASAASHHPLFIDHHQSLNGMDDRTSFIDTPFYFRTEIYDFVLGWPSFEPWLSIAEATDHKTLRDLVGDLAPEWHVGQAFQQATVAHLARRQHLIRPQIARLRDRKIPLFLNWNKALSLRNGTA